MNSGRRYSMAVRGKQAAATRQRILDAARDRLDLRSRGFTLDDVAAAAGVSTQTVLRAFGSKEGLVLAAMGTTRAEVPDPADAPSDLDEAVRHLVDDYERIGDRVLWMLAEEHRISGFAEAAAEGRRRHHAWIDAVFAEHLAGRRPIERDEILSALLVATDVYTWKILRRDLGLDRGTTEAVIRRLASGALTTDHHRGG